MQNNILQLARPEIVAMHAYASARSISVNGNIWLDANENPWNDTLYNRYPEPQPPSLISCFASTYAVKQEQVLVTRGSDEGIDLLIRLFCRAGKDKILITPPTYGMYKVAATIQDAGIVEIPLLKENNFTLDLAKILEQWGPHIKVIFLCSPNNPTGNLLSVADIVTLCRELDGQAIIVVDEAYVEFSMSESIVMYINDNTNLVVLRTLSKAYGLAGLRCGVTLANEIIIELLKKIIAPYPISKPIANIITKQLNVDVVKERINLINQEKEKLLHFLSKHPMIKKVWKSDANYLLFETTDAKRMLEACLAKGIVLRDRSSDYNLKNCIRVSIGLAEENEYLMKVLHNV